MLLGLLGLGVLKKVVRCFVLVVFFKVSLFWRVIIMKIVSFWSGHDCSFCVLENGMPKLHVEYERYIREKEPKGDSIKLFFDICGEDELEDVTDVAVCHPIKDVFDYAESWKKLYKICEKKGIKEHVLGNHF